MGIFDIKNLLKIQKRNGLNVVSRTVLSEHRISEKAEFQIGMSSQVGYGVFNMWVQNYIVFINKTNVWSVEIIGEGPNFCRNGFLEEGAQIRLCAL